MTITAGTAGTHAQSGDLEAAVMAVMREVIAQLGDARRPGDDTYVQNLLRVSTARFDLASAAATVDEVIAATSADTGAFAITCSLAVLGAWAATSPTERLPVVTGQVNAGTNPTTAVRAGDGTRFTCPRDITGMPNTSALQWAADFVSCRGTSLHIAPPSIAHDTGATAVYRHLRRAQVHPAEALLAAQDAITGARTTTPAARGRAR